MAEKSHYSIGEVLSLLKEEHADITISKIRFLESQGLIEPERTASGYRKFYSDDVDRLRWILSQQRDNFLPLKVIKRRLADEGFDLSAEIAAANEARDVSEPSLFAPDLAAAAAVAAQESLEQPSQVAESAPAQTAAEVQAAAVEAPPVTAPPAVVGSMTLSVEELIDAAGSDIATVNELERIGLIESTSTGAGPSYDHEALITLQAAMVFKNHGMEVRHLRMFRVGADREAGMFQQLRGAALQRGGEAGAAARADLETLIEQGDVIRRSILRRELGL